MPDIKQITLPSGTTYDLRDSRVDSIISQGTRWVGVTITELYDGATTSTITIDGASHTAEIGDIAGYAPSGKQQEEFIWSGSVWQEFGSTGSLKALAFKDSVAVTTPVPATYTTTFTGKQKSVSVSGTTTGSVTETKGAVEIKTKNSGTNSYTPAGSVSTPTISVKTAGSTGKVTGITAVGTLPSCTLPTYTVANGVLTITGGSFSAGTLPTADTEKTFKTGDASYKSSQPSFTGTATYLETASDVLTGASFSGASMTSTGNYTPEATSISTTTATTNNVSGTVTYSPS